MGSYGLKDCVANGYREGGRNKPRNDDLGSTLNKKKCSDQDVFGSGRSQVTYDGASVGEVCFGLMDR